MMTTSLMVLPHPLTHNPNFLIHSPLNCTPNHTLEASSSAAGASDAAARPDAADDAFGRFEAA